jgi:hypothetical protein
MSSYLLYQTLNIMFSVVERNTTVYCIGDLCMELKAAKIMSRVLKREHFVADNLFIFH